MADLGPELKKWAALQRKREHKTFDIDPSNSAVFTGIPIANASGDSTESGTGVTHRRSLQLFVTLGGQLVAVYNQQTNEPEGAGTFKWFAWTVLRDPASLEKWLNGIGVGSQATIGANAIKMAKDNCMPLKS